MEPPLRKSSQPYLLANAVITGGPYYRVRYSVGSQPFCVGGFLLLPISTLRHRLNMPCRFDYGTVLMGGELSQSDCCALSHSFLCLLFVSMAGGVTVSALGPAMRGRLAVKAISSRIGSSLIGLKFGLLA